MAKLKTAIGFHMGVPSYADGIGDYWRKLFENGDAVIAKGVRNAGPVFETQELAKQYPDVPAYGIYRIDMFSWGNDVPNYNADPADMAKVYWDETDAMWPSELDKSFAWVELYNEVDKGRSEWIGQLSVECAKIALERGYKFLAPAWSGGECEPSDWEYQSWYDYFALCQEYPNQIGISLHEYTFTTDKAMLDTAPHLIGRVLFMNEVAINAGYKPPTTFISEWGYGATNAPSHVFGVPDMIETVDWYIRRAPNVKGVLIWCLDSGGQWGKLSKVINSYIEPMGNHIVATNWPLPQEPEEPVPPVPEEPKHKVVLVKVSQDHGADAWSAISAYAHSHYKRTMTASIDDMLTMMRSGNALSYVIIIDPERTSQEEAIGRLEAEGFRYEVEYVDDPEPTPHDDLFRYRPCDTSRVTQKFGANPQWYLPFGQPSHGGIDYGVAMGLPYYAVQGGEVVHASNQRPSGGTSNFGYHTIVKHAVGDLIFHTVYAHAEPNLPVKKGDMVEAGDVVGKSGNTGNSSGPHLHFALLWPTNPGNGFPRWTHGYAVDPAPYLEGKDRPPIIERDTVDLLNYIRGNGVLYEVSNANGGSERFQAQVKGLGEFWQTKNQNAEQFFYSNNSIYRGWDTSPSELRYYQLQEPKGNDRSKWMPRHMVVGEVFAVSLWVQFYTNDCRPSLANTGGVTDIRRLVKKYDTWTSKAGITLQDVIQIEWSGGETYWYAKDYGLVQWARTHEDPDTPSWSAISEIHSQGQRPDNVAILPGCLQ